MIRRTLRDVKGLSAADRSWLAEWLDDYLDDRDDEIKAVRRLGEIVAAAKVQARREPA
jgi:hypothetical protein